MQLILDRPLARNATSFSGWAHYAMLTVLAFEGLGALVGGPLLVAAPDGHLMDLPIEVLRGTFPDFLVPGLLLTALGLLNVAAFVVVLLRRRSGRLWAELAMGGFLVWFAVELAIVGYGSVAQLVWGLPVLIGSVLAVPF